MRVYACVSACERVCARVCARIYSTTRHLRQSPPSDMYVSTPLHVHTQSGGEPYNITHRTAVATVRSEASQEVLLVDSGVVAVIVEVAVVVVVAVVVEERKIIGIESLLVRLSMWAGSSQIALYMLLYLDLFILYIC